ncbi:hypothetical protein GCM10008171_01000 [Methylopila jiangsuensis]|uniref:VWFA domain-containing protein n=1 Tax=Methylopila jiangsuensis TaxID=586230 RepID=A0A9W6N244_9HYPH|nr:vWA domain-containing protein [Methylopila jiangsuensis]MDR6287192.1 mxaL protein [Methylopila jiangsuensis]GLK74848.1 hypothetical protein GCM10008171_01000 [Methylopila jiangsuensis]
MKRPDLRTLALGGALALAVVAALQPEAQAERPTYDVIAYVDITGSMSARDYVTADGKPQSRLEAVKQRLAAAAGRLPCGSRFGLGVFTERRIFLLFEPMETCRNYVAISGAIKGLDWRMGWEGDSRISAGLFRAIDATRPTGADVVFLTDGQEAPPLRTDMEQTYDGEQARGLIVGVGGTDLVPIPKFNDFGREIGFYSMEDVPQASRLGGPPKGAENLPGYNARNAPFGEMPAGEEHLTSVKEPYLRQLGQMTGLGYARLGTGDELAAAIEANARPHPHAVPIDLSPAPAAAALLALAALYGTSLVARPRRRRPLNAQGVSS